MPPKKPTPKRVPVSSHKHKSKRVNIPTRELRGFVEQDEKTPKQMVRFVVGWEAVRRQQVTHDAR